MHTLIHTNSIQQIDTECLLYAGYYSKCSGYSTEKRIKTSVLKELRIIGDSHQKNKYYILIYYDTARTKTSVVKELRIVGNSQQINTIYMMIALRR